MCVCTRARKDLAPDCDASCKIHFPPFGILKGPEKTEGRGDGGGGVEND